jgi:hypothetical protein
VQRIYDTTNYRKHKQGGWGAPCPDDLDQDVAQELLSSAVAVDGALWNVDGERCFRAFQHETTPEGIERWHGHPIAWARLPKDAVTQLVVRRAL